MEVDPLYLAEHTDELEKNPYLSAKPAIGTPEQNLTGIRRTCTNGTRNGARSIRSR